MKYLKVLLIGVLALLVLSVGPLFALAKKPSLTLWGPSSLAEIKILQDMIRRFESNTGIRVDYRPLSGSQSEQRRRLFSVANTGSGPDILIADISMAALLAEQGVILSLEDRFIQRVTPAFIPQTLDAFRFGPHQRLYGIPRQFHSLVLFYNEEIFRKCDIQRPSSDWTWQDLATAARGLDHQASIPGVVVTDDFTGFFPFGIANGILEEEPILAAEALKYYIDWRKSGLIIDAGEIGSGWAGQAFVNERAAMAISGSWLIKFIEETRPELTYEVVPLPTAEAGGRGNLIYADAYLITETAGLRDTVGVAEQLIEFLSQEIQERWFEAGLGLPPSKNRGENLVERYPHVHTIYQAVIGAEPQAFGLSEFPSALIHSIKDGIASEEELSFEQAQQLLEQALTALPQSS